MSDDNLSDATKKLIENMKPTNQRTSIFASQSDFDALSREMNKAADRVKLFGVEVRYSPYIEPGSVYIHKDAARRTRPFQPITLDNEARINRWIHGNMGRFFGHPKRMMDEYTEKFTGYAWPEYLKRCGLGVLDNPAIRWEYQKYIWSTPIRLIKRFIAWCHTVQA